MRIAVDWDGTLAKHAELYVMLSNLAEDNEVVILTAGAGELPMFSRCAEMTKRITKRYPDIFGKGGAEIKCVEQCDKGAWCRAYDVRLIIDDSDSVLADVAVKSPGTVRLKVMK